MTDNKDPKLNAEFVDYRFGEVFKRLDRMEQTMNGFAFVKQTDFEKFKEEVKQAYVTKEEHAPVQKVFYGILIAGVMGLVGLFFWLIQFVITKAAS